MTQQKNVYAACMCITGCLECTIYCYLWLHVLYYPNPSPNPNLRQSDVWVCSGAQMLCGNVCCKRQEDKAHIPEVHGARFVEPGGIATQLQDKKVRGTDQGRDGVAAPGGSRDPVLGGGWGTGLSISCRARWMLCP